VTDYLELSLAVRPDAVESAADILRRYVPDGVSIEAPVEPLDEDGGVAFLDAPVRLRAWLAVDGAAREAAVRRLRGELRSLGDAIAAPLRTHKVADASWADAWKRYFTVLRVGERIVIRPSWRAHRRKRDDVVIDLDPGMAFGTGQHETTRMCLEAIEQRSTPGATVLDLGAGSGILSIAAALLGAARVDAVDINPICVRVCEENVARNRVDDRVRTAEGSLGDAWPFAEPRAARYDVVLANISARVIQELAVPIIEALRPGGVAIISGVISEQEQPCAVALTAAGGRIVETRSGGEWRLLLATTA
jgi:ribosomal protein L11 methyltransferase